MAYPTDADLQAQLEELEFWWTGFSVVVAGRVAQAISFFEKMSGNVPYVADASPSEERYDWNRAIALRNPYQTITEVRVNVSYGFAGTVLTEEKDYFLGPSGASGDGNPYRLIRFSPNYAICALGGLQSVKVTGIKGYAADCPSDLFAAILDCAKGLCYIDIYDKLTNGIIEVKDDDVTVKFDSIDFNELAKSAKGQAMAIFNLYANRLIGLS